VWFIGSGTQAVSATGGESFGYFLLKNTGSVQLGSAVGVTGAAGDALQILSTGNLDLKTQTLTMSGGGALKVDAGARFVIGTGGGTLAFSAPTSVNPTGGGSLSLGTTVTAALSNGVAFNSTTLNGTLQLNAGGFVNTT